jgi:hypothetical protein
MARIAVVNSSAVVSSPKGKRVFCSVQTRKWHMPSKGKLVLNLTSLVKPST